MARNRKANEERYKKTDKYRIQKLYNAARARAKKNNRVFTITKEWVEEKLKKGECEVTGVKFSYTKKRNYVSAPYTPSLDRKNSKLGYTKRNTQIVCNFYNIVKWNWDKADVKKILEILKTVKI